MQETPCLCASLLQPISYTYFVVEGLRDSLLGVDQIACLSHSSDANKAMPIIGIRVAAAPP